MFTPALIFNFPLRTRVAGNKHPIFYDKGRATSSATVSRRAWDRVAGRLETIHLMLWPRSQDKPDAKLATTAITSPLPSDAWRASAQALEPGLPFSPRPAAVYALPSLASSGMTLPPTPGPVTPTRGCSREPDFDGKSKLGNGTTIGKGERVVELGLGYPSTRFGRQPRMVTMRLGEWDVTPFLECSREPYVNSEAKPVNGNTSSCSGRARLGCSSTTVTMRLGEFNLGARWPKVMASGGSDGSASTGELEGEATLGRGTGKQPRTVTMRLGEFDLARNADDIGRNRSASRGDCKRMLPPARFRDGTQMVTMRLGEFKLVSEWARV
ncbi:hypothetical protein EW145_g4206 [Phellinidium pouzarii]|uniref:Uncharacterized protein n=1 Tax=Phellinidium pouzarii TaxID=167371 RepID=A0A4S4L4K3_9AGAM|nr:hypothetical protein EW145_g4206 [Phellinidium pouzarii]